MSNRVGVPRLASDSARGWLTLIVTMALGLVAPFVLRGWGVSSNGDRLAAPVLITWAFLGLFFTALTLIVFRRATGAELASWMRATTPPGTGRARFWYIFSGGGALGWALSGSVVAVISVLGLSLLPAFREPLVVFSGIAVVIASLMMIITAYAVRYAREHATNGGIDFPDEDAPRFSDFLYLAVQVATTFSSSDVRLTSRKMRSLVTTNSLIAFSFNTVIVALLVAVLV